MIEDVEAVERYTTHSVVHTWAYHYSAKQVEPELARAATLTVGSAVPMEPTRDYTTMYRRFLPHAQVCSRRAVNALLTEDDCEVGGNENEDEDINSLLDAIHMLSLLYEALGRLDEAEKMYMRALQGYEKAWGAEHTSTLNTVNNLGLLYVDLGRLDEAEKMYMRALQGYEKAHGQTTIEMYVPALNAMWAFGDLHAERKQKQSAKAMYERALAGFTIVRGSASDPCSHIRSRLQALDMLEENKISVKTSPFKGLGVRLKRHFKSLRK